MLTDPFRAYPAASKNRCGAYAGCYSVIIGNRGETSMMRGTICGASIALAAAAWLSGANATAESSKVEAKQHFDAGNALVDNEDYAAATSEFELSVRIYPTKMGLFNLANCYKALNRYGDALEALARLESEFAGKLGTLSRDVSSLKNTIEGMVGRLDVKVDKGGAAIRVDGADVGTSPLAKPLVLSPGDHVIEARLPGFTDASKTVRIAARETLEASFVLVEEPPPVVAPLAPEPPVTAETGTTSPEAQKPVAAVGGSAAPVVVPVETPPPPPPEGRRKGRGLRAGAWASFIVGMTAGLVSIACYGLASTEAEEFANSRRDYRAAVDELESDGPTAATVGDTERAWKEMERARDAAVGGQKLGLGFGIGAGVLVAAATALFLASYYKGESDEAPAAVAVAPGGLAVEF
jgi:hypothetical protein